MKLTKMIMIVLTAMLIAAPAFAGNCPEYDAVGCDASNHFVQKAWIPLGWVCNMNLGYVPDAGCVAKINEYSRFPFGIEFPDWGEKFEQTAGELTPDPCFPGYFSALAPSWGGGAIFKWWIVLQMQPESDINVNIYDCVLKHNETDIWTEAQQTGRYRTCFNEPIFDPEANPTITVKAYEGQYNTRPGHLPGALIGTMDARVLPGLHPVSVKDILYTSKALFDEGIVLVMPKTGDVNKSGQTMTTLQQGDMLKVKIEIPGTNCSDIRYGNDSVIVKYIGMIGTWYTTDDCGPCECVCP